MACTVNTLSITLSTLGGVLSANSNISAPVATAAPNLLSIAADGLFVDGSDGWVVLPASLAYSSTTGATDAACYICTSSVDLSVYLTPGMKCSLVHGGVTKYFRVVAVAAGTITLWGGSAYSLSAGAITSPMFSAAERPALFPSLPTTIPPAVAYEGMEVTLIADAASGVEWYLKFRSAEATYKWRVVGGAPLFNEVTAQQATASAAYTPLGTAGPSITPSRAGDYIVAIGCWIATTGSNANDGYMSYDIGGSGAGDADAMISGGSAGGTNLSTSGSRERPKTITVAGTALVAKYRVPGAVSTNFGNRWMRVTPVRII